MSKIPPHIIDEIMQVSRIEEVIADYVQLKRAGSNLKGLSPFTDEKTPSFVVSPAKQIFKCFSTGKGGTVVSFLMEKEHFSYPEALRWLADRFGVQIPELTQPSAEELAELNERESFYIINEFAKNTFSQNMLETDEGKAIGLSYFEERGFRKDIIERFQLGYCLNKGDDFTKKALAKGYKLDYLEKVGLVKTKEDRSFDFFRGRVMFPIHSISGRVLGFGGRTLMADKKIAKYFNSPESVIYNKSEILYGLYFAKGDIVKYDECLLCEGYTDVISMHQAGMQHVVSSSGTSLTKEQVKLVKRYTKNLTILYDGDAAGIKASFRGIDLILEEGMNVKVVLFPDGEDPDSFSKTRSSSELETYIKTHKQDFITFKSSILLADGLNDPLRKSELIKDMVHSVSLMPDQITRSVYVQEIARQFDISESIVNNELMRLRKSTMAKQLQEPMLNDVPLPKESVNLLSDDPSLQNQPDSAAKEEIIHEEELIRLMIKYGTREVLVKELGNEDKSTSVIELIIQEIEQDDLRIEHPLLREIYGIFMDGIKDNTLLSTSYLKRIENQEIVAFVSDVESDDRELSHNWVSKYNIYTKSEADDLYESVMNVIYHFKLIKIEQHIQKIQQELKEVNPQGEDLVLLLSELMMYAKIKNEFSEKLGRIITR
ncbi:MAG: DNA primase [Crocinitomicaceae bacterium]|nr:DNA primase [Crocinitomicaceae bacterium]MDP4760865.1 DNA primase [Crocinitomicaceae bacterium]